MKIASAVLALFTLAFLAGAALLAYRSAALLLGGTRTEGEVVRMEGVPGSGSSPDLDAPILRFRVDEGRTAEVRGPAEQYSGYGVGDVVTLHYWKEAPTQAKVASFDGLWIAPLACLVVSLLLGGTAGVVLAADRNAPTPVLVGAVFLMVGVPPLLGGIAQAVDRSQLLRNGARAQGVIANGEGKPWKLFKTSSESRELPAKIRFTTAEGRRIEVTTPELNAVYGKLDEPVDLVYPSRQPHAAAVLRFSAFWLSSMVLGGVGAVFTGIGALLSRSFRAGRRRRGPGKG